jgi:hypothetical protein
MSVTFSWMAGNIATGAAREEASISLIVPRSVSRVPWTAWTPFLRWHVLVRKLLAGLERGTEGGAVQRRRDSMMVNRTMAMEAKKKRVHLLFKCLGLVPFIRLRNGFGFHIYRLGCETDIAGVGKSRTKVVYERKW